MERQKIRVANWNLDHASNSSRPIEQQIETIKQIGPDILILTETCEQVDLTPYGYTVTYAVKNDYGKYPAAVWSKFPFVRHHETSDETAVCAQLATPLGGMLVYGTIITYHGDKGPDNNSGAWIEHYKAIEKQGCDWDRLRAETALPLIVAGDFNQTRDGSTRTYGTSQGRKLLTEQLSKSGLICLTTEDFGANKKLKIDPKKGWHRNNIDHICVTQHLFEIIKVGAWDHFTDDGVYLSDHNGVYVDLSA